MNLFFTGVQNDEVKLREGKTAAVGQQSTAIKMKTYAGEESIDCSTDSTWESGFPHHHYHHTPTHHSTPSLHQLAHWLPETVKDHHETSCVWEMFRHAL